MSTYILTSMFPNGLDIQTADLFQRLIVKRNSFVFIASEFEKMHEKTDRYFHFFLNIFRENGIEFETACVVDGRMTAEEAQKTVKDADVVWLSGGNTPIEFKYLQKYGLDKVLKQHQGVLIGMSAGSINMAETAICTLSCGHAEQIIYQGIGCVNISVEPHFRKTKLTDELLELSKKYVIYGLCDESVIVSKDDQFEFYGEIYKIHNQQITQVF